MPSPTPTPGSSPKAAAPVPQGSGGFTVDTTGLGNSSSSSNPFASDYLPNGDYDTFNLGSVYDKTLYLGQQHTDEGAYHNISNVTTTAEDYMQRFAGSSQTNANTFAQQQLDLYNAGFYGSGTPTLGAYDDGLDRAAMTRAIKGYLAVVNPDDPNPLTFAEYLDHIGALGKGQGRGSGGGGGATRAPLQLTASATLQQVANAQSQNELGRGATTAEQNAFVGKYHGEEQSAYNGGKENAGDPTAEAKSFVDSQSTQENQVHIQAGYAAQMLQMLGVK